MLRRRWSGNVHWPMAPNTSFPLSGVLLLHHRTDYCAHERSSQCRLITHCSPTRRGRQVNRSLSQLAQGSDAPIAAATEKPEG